MLNYKRWINYTLWYLNKRKSVDKNNKMIWGECHCVKIKTRVGILSIDTCNKDWNLEGGDGGGCKCNCQRKIGYPW